MDLLAVAGGCQTTPQPRRLTVETPSLLSNLPLYLIKPQWNWFETILRA